jgi:arylsulfatase A
VEKEIEEVLRKANSPELVPWVERTDYFYKVFKNKDAERLRIEFMRLNVFQESWIPILKSGSYKRFQLFDLAADPSQEVDVSKQYPEVFARLKRQLLEVNASVMAEAPDWGSADEAPTSPSRNRDASNTLTSPNAELLAQIDAIDLPQGYTPGNAHQDYVDRRMAGLSSRQRARIGQLWQEKRRLDPSMPNRGHSFVKIMEFVAEHEKPQNSSRREETTTEVRVRPPAAPETVTRPTSSSSPKNRPNVVVLLADDLGWKDIGCYGGPVKTPTLDSLAAQGVRFTDFHAGAAICSPSRATLMTGRQHLRTGIYGVLQDHLHNAHLLEREVTIAEVLQQTGYSTAHFGKWHIGMTSGKRKKPSPTEHGFDYWFGLSNGAHPSHKDPINFLRNGQPVGPLKGYSCQLLVDDAIRWLDAKDKPDQPFSLSVWFNEPHHPLAAPDEIVSQYGDLKEEAAIYSATIDNTDRSIGRLVAKLKEMDQLDNTLIVYSSDNGSYRADRNGGLHGNKGSNFEGGLRSPGIFFWPRGIRGGRVENTPSGSVDLLPTICGLAGIEKPPGVHLDGADLSPLLTERGRFQRTQPLFWLTPTSGHLGTLRDGRYTLMGYRGYDLPEEHATRDKLLRQMARLAGIDDDAENLRSRIANTTFTSPEFRRLRGEYVKLTTFQESWIPIIKSGGFSRFALYDLASDPTQMKDVSRQHPEVTARLKKKLLTLYKSVMADAPDWSAQQ